MIKVKDIIHHPYFSIDRHKATEHVVLSAPFYLLQSNIIFQNVHSYKSDKTIFLYTRVNVRTDDIAMQSTCILL